MAQNQVLPVQVDLIPGFLRNRSQWVVWRLESRKGKATKIPYDAKNGGMGKSNDSSTWASFDVAVDKYNRGGFSGIGFVFNEGDGLVGVDLDHVIDTETGEISSLALPILEKFQATYIEISPSGTGIRVFCFGKPGRCGKNTGKVKWAEIYDHTSPRYLTVTGHALGGSADITEQQVALDWLHASLFAESELKANPSKNNSSLPALPLSDAELIRKIESSKSGAEFRALFGGSLEAHGGDHSSADLALCSMLAWWTNKDEGQIDRIFRQSGLMREKWGKRHRSSDGATYGQMTIEKAVTSCTGGYEPRTPSAGTARGFAVSSRREDAGMASQAEPAGGAVDLEAVRLEFEGRIGVLVRPEDGELLAVEVNASALTEPGKNRLLGKIAKATGLKLSDLKPGKRKQPAGFEDDNDGGDGPRSSRVPPVDGRPDVDIGADRLVSAMLHAEQILFGEASKEPPYYQAGGILMRIQGIDQNWADGERVGAAESMTLVPVDEDWLRQKMMRHIRFMKWSSSARQWQPCNLPRDYAASYIASGDWAVPVLNGIIHVPVLRMDGTIHATPGYDPESGLYLDSREKWKLPPKRTRGEVIDPASDKSVRLAFELFYDLFNSFNPVTLGDFASAVSVILAGLVKHEIGGTPGLAITSPTPGSGKGKIAHIISAILTGHEAPMMVYTNDEPKFEEMIFSKLLAREPLIVIDEVKGQLKSAFMDSCLTEKSVNKRILGISRNARVKPHQAFYFAIGNNFSVEQDKTRRWLRCRIDPGCAKPEERMFDRDPVEYAKANRVRFVAAALAILQAYMHMGMPSQGKTLGSFEPWSKIVRGALVWAGFGDPCDSQTHWVELDQSALLLGRVLAAWHGLMEKFGEADKQIAVADIVKLAVDGENNCPRCAEFLACMKEIRDCYDSKKGTYKPGPLSYQLRSWRDKVARFSFADKDGKTITKEFKLISTGLKRNVAMWRVDAM